MVVTAVPFPVSVPGAVLGVGVIVGSHGVTPIGPPVVSRGGMFI